MSHEKLQTMISKILGGKRGILWDLCFVLSPCILERFTFLYYANEESNNVMNGSTKTESRISLEILEQCPLNFGTSTLHSNLFKVGQSVMLRTPMVPTFS